MCRKVSLQALGIAALLSLGAGRVLADATTAGVGDPGVPPAKTGEGPTEYIEDFDSYGAGSDMHGQGGWKGWDNNPGAGALVSNAQAHTVPNSVDINGPSDLVHEFAGFNSGFWIVSSWAFIPSAQASTLSFFILLNTYADFGPYNWSTQVCFNSASGMVVDDVAGDCTTGTSIPIVFDQWVEIRVEIDLDANTQSFFYDNNLLFSDSWTEHVSGGGVANIAAIDLFANNSTSVFWDDVSICSDGSCFVPVSLQSVSIDE